YDLADIFRCDIDFTTDIKKGDSYKIIVEEYYSNGIFKHYGRILYAEIINDGVTHEAYWFDKGKIHGYFNSEGKSFQTALTRAPLQFRYISSYFTYNRLHPILKIRRPHLGVDYAAAAGTPVSAAGDGLIAEAGYNGQIGNHIRITHPGGYRTNYGHLQRFASGIHSGVRVKQGEIIGYVGSTGLATGPHLDYRVQLNNVPINPLSMKLPTLQSISPKYVNNFIVASAKIKGEMAALYANMDGFKNLKKTAHF
ncbi:MAG: M23 family metallopeptidase, partial [Nitrospirae bacterium]|nr:M23 family metallopeptidase [Nitrospirota bacterium]